MNKKCNKCGRIWEAIDNNEKCPFCGYVTPKAEEFHSVSEALAFLVKNYGVNIYQNPDRMIAYLRDYAPKYNTESRFLKHCADANIFPLFLSANEKNTNEAKIAAIRKSVYVLYDAHWMAFDNAKKILSWIGSSLAWDPSLFDGNDLVTSTNNYTDSASSVWVAAPNQEADSNTNQLEDEFEIDGTTLISYHGFSEAVCIPSIITKIEAQAFKGCSFIKQLTLASTIREIGPYAFSGCSALTEISIPEGVVKLEKGLFLVCTGLKEIYLPNSLETIESFAFAGCCALETINLPEGVKQIDDLAFQSCARLRECRLPNSLVSLNSRVFKTCRSLVSLDVPNSMCSIGGSFSFDCPNLKRFGVRNDHIESNDIQSKNDKPHALTARWPETLKSFDIPSTITEIGDDVFSYCQKLSAIVIPMSVRKIGSRAFKHCSDLHSVVLEGKGITIGKEAFWGCKSLREIDISAITGSIPDSLFCECSRLSHIIIPHGIRRIGNSAFANCKSLSWVEMPRTIETLGKNILIGHSNSMMVYASHNEYVANYAKKEGLLYTDLSYAESEKYGTILRRQHAYLSENKTLSATSDYAYAVRNDGMVVMFNINSYESAIHSEKWNNIKTIIASRHHKHVMGVKNDGTVIVFSRMQSRSKQESAIRAWKDIRSLAVGRTHIFGLKENGTVIVTQSKRNMPPPPDVSSMESVIQLAAGYDHVVGLKQDGTVVSAGGGNYGQCAVGHWKNIVSVYATQHFTLGLTFDGRVLIAGAINSKEYEHSNQGKLLDENRLTSYLYNISRLFISDDAIVGTKDDQKGTAVYIDIEASDYNCIKVAEITNEMFSCISDIVCVRCGLFALQNNGKVVFTKTSSKNAPDVSVFQEIKVPHYVPSDRTNENAMSLASGK